MIALRRAIAASIAAAGLIAAGAAQAQYPGHGYRGSHHFHGGPRVGVYFGAAVPLGFAPPYAGAYAYAYPYGYPYGYAYGYPYAARPPLVVVPDSPPTYVERADGVPESSAEQAQAESGYWYYCNESRAYYPQVQTCAGPWQPVAPRPGS